MFGDGVLSEKDSQCSLTGIFLLENVSVWENTGYYELLSLLTKEDKYAGAGEGYSL